jgi:hypothetical protein
MAGSTPIYGFPYPESSDLVANYPALGQDLAEEVETVIDSLPAATIVQVKNVFKNNAFSTTSTSYTDITGLTVNITPTSATNKILVIANVTLANAGDGSTGVRLLRGATVIGSASGQTGFYAGFPSRFISSADWAMRYSLTSAGSFSYLDSPASTSAQTYKIQMIAGASAALVNKSVYDGYAVSSITLMEVTA